MKQKKNYKYYLEMAKTNHFNKMPIMEMEKEDLCVIISYLSEELINPDVDYLFLTDIYNQIKEILKNKKFSKVV